MDEFVTLDSLSVSASDIYSNFSRLVLNLFHKKRINLCFLLNCNGYYNIARIFAKSNSIARACFIFPLSTLMTSINYTSSSFAKLFLSKRIFRRINSFPAHIRLRSTQSYYHDKMLRHILKSTPSLYKIHGKHLCRK